MVRYRRSSVKFGGLFTHVVPSDNSPYNPPSFYYPISYKFNCKQQQNNQLHSVLLYLHNDHNKNSQTSQHVEQKHTLLKTTNHSTVLILRPLIITKCLPDLNQHLPIGFPVPLFHSHRSDTPTHPNIRARRSVSPPSDSSLMLQVLQKTQPIW